MYDPYFTLNFLLITYFHDLNDRVKKIIGKMSLGRLIVIYKLCN